MPSSPAIHAYHAAVVSAEPQALSTDALSNSAVRAVRLRDLFTVNSVLSRARPVRRTVTSTVRIGVLPNEVTDRCVVRGASTPAQGTPTSLSPLARSWSDRVVRIPLLLARAQLRRGWRSLVGIVLLIALVGGLMLAGLAGAQRTRTAVDRMIDATDAADILVNPDNGDESVLDFDTVAALPMVADFSRLHGVIIFPSKPFASIDEITGFFDGVFFATDGAALVRFERPILTDGHVPDPASLDEIYLDRTYASREGIDVGDSLSLRVIPDDVFDRAQTVFEAGDGERDESGGLAVLNDPTAGTTVELRVAGIGTGLDGVAVDEGYEPIAAWIGPALYESLGEPTAGYGGAAVRLNDPSQIAEFKAAVDAMAPDEKIVYQTQAVTRAKALRATQPAAIALAIFAAVTALLGLLLIGQAISRWFQLDSRDNQPLAALGTTQRERFVTSMIRLTLAALAGVVVSIAIAFLLSALTPVGPARLAEPDAGFNFDPTIVLTGAGLLSIAIITVGAIPAWHAARQTDRSPASHGSSVAAWLAGRGASPQLTTGVRFGLEPGRGSTAVPTRATIIGAITAITVAVATIVFASSLDRVVNDGRFYGSNFDVAIDFDGNVAGDDVTMTGVMSIVAAEPAVERVGEMRITEILVNGEAVTSVAFDSTGPASPVEPTVAVGRAPAAADEIAFGRTTLRELGVGIGDTVSVETAGFDGDAEVVGRAVLPGVGLYQGSDRTSIGVGALVDPESLGPRDGSSKSFVVVDLEPDTDEAAFEQRMSEDLAEYGLIFFGSNPRPSDIQGLAQLRSLPVALAASLVVLVAITVVHAMVVAVRRRRRDVAILQALGSTRGEVTAIGVWQGTTIGVTALLFGVPLGIVVGRWCWTLLANEFGTLAEPVVPLLGVGLLIVTVMALAAAAGVVPIRRGLRHLPADVLRSE